MTPGQGVVKTSELHFDPEKLAALQERLGSPDALELKKDAEKRKAEEEAMQLHQKASQREKEMKLLEKGTEAEALLEKASRVLPESSETQAQPLQGDRVSLDGSETLVATEPALSPTAAHFAKSPTAADLRSPEPLRRFEIGDEVDIVWDADPFTEQQTYMPAKIVAAGGNPRVYSVSMSTMMGLVMDDVEGERLALPGAAKRTKLAADKRPATDHDQERPVDLVESGEIAKLATQSPPIDTLQPPTIDSAAVISPSLARMPRREGVLQKKATSGISHPWQDRFFVADDCALSYWKSAKRRGAPVVVSLEDAEIHHDAGSREFAVAPAIGKRYRLRAASPEALMHG
eukprot:INCI7171.3.p1 GENE.INCI7171.3~~INCI7171.3.p1  ORF type:complete len:346 (-),score=63.43 INCI7171.3:474-1511(-)